MDITHEQLYEAFVWAENQTAREFGGAVCSMRNRTGEDECPICYFYAALKRELGFPAKHPETGSKSETKP